MLRIRSWIVSFINSFRDPLKIKEKLILFLRIELRSQRNLVVFVSRFLRRLIKWLWLKSTSICSLRKIKFGRGLSNLNLALKVLIVVYKNPLLCLGALIGRSTLLVKVLGGSLMMMIMFLFGRMLRLGMPL